MSPEHAVAERLKAFDAVERIVLFGSRARADHGPRADIDLAVDCPGADPVVWADMVEAA
ncbi:MAG: polymerase beta, Nucleotidyltransferase, partial [Caulobacteraceae bacterium]|nr:polymerase beta, Nucleotidyltransferase [Caulobacteraceae bacterium]